MIESQFRLILILNLRRRKSKQSAFTLVELLTVLAIIGLVFSLALPAVMDARAAAQRVSCANNIRQVGSGLHGFESTWGRFPGVYWGTTGSVALGDKRQWSYSPSSLIAASLNSQSLAERVPVEQSLGSVDPDWSGLGLPAPAVLHCPSDALATDETSSYRYCRGNLPLWPKDPGGAFVSDDQGFRIAEITDGLSHTAFVSERLISIPVKGWPDRRRDLIELGTPNSANIAITCLEANVRANSATATDWSRDTAGTSWLSGRWLHASYYHLLPPNSAFADCRNSDISGLAVLTARSNHPRGVNVLFGDGSVRFVNDHVAMEVWRSWATRAGSDGLIGE
jgi:prepilin-type N-terminal cleavage/methylation domain-containing protein/prepilin-type processing-associated H-X9-DG protein